MRLPAALSVLKNRSFRLYWFGQAISLIGTWMQTMAQQWVVTSRSQSASVLGSLHIVATLPVLVLSLQGGALADRLEKRRILLCTQAAMMSLALLFSLLLYTKVLVLWHVFALAFLLGLATAFDLPATHAFTPELVEPGEIPRAVALMQSIFHGARLIGPALAGVLIVQLGEGSAFLVNGLSFLAVIACLWAIRSPEARPPEVVGEGAQSPVREGFAYLRQEPWARACIVLTGLTTTLIFPFVVVLMVYYIRHILQADAQGMGLMMSASGLGSLLGALLLLVGKERERRVRAFCGILGGAGALIGLSLSASLWLSVLLFGFLAFSVSSLLGTISQILQERVRGDLRGRVMSIHSIAFSGLLPFSALLLSLLSDYVGLLRLMQICGACYALLALWFLGRSRETLFLPEA